MAKKPSTEQLLAQLRTLRSCPPSPESLSTLTNLLRQPNLHGIIIKSAATLAANHTDPSTSKTLTDPLAQTILSLITDKAPQKRDPGSEGKTAALSTLINWDADLPDLYLQASTYRQLEPTFGNPVDSAAEFRGLSAIGLSLTRPINALESLVDLLTDPEKTTRARTAIALGRWRGPEAIPLLRLKAKSNDPDPEVLAETLASLLQQNPNQLPFVAQFLHHKIPANIEAAALAIGQSKPDGALPTLTAAFPPHRGSPIATTLLMAIALLRSPESITFLLNLLKENQSHRPRESANILDALSLHRTNPKITAQIQAALPNTPDLQKLFHELFPPT